MKVVKPRRSRIATNRRKKDDDARRTTILNALRTYQRANIALKALTDVSWILFNSGATIAAYRNARNAAEDFRTAATGSVVDALLRSGAKYGKVSEIVKRLQNSTVKELTSEKTARAMACEICEHCAAVETQTKNESYVGKIY